MDQRVWFASTLILVSLKAFDQSQALDSALFAGAAILNTALSLVIGLSEQGEVPGFGMAFLVAGGVTSIPATKTVWTLVKPQIIARYIALSLSGVFAAGLLFQLWTSMA